MNRRHEGNERDGRRKDRVGVAPGLVDENLYGLFTGFFHQDRHPGMGGFEVNEELMVREPLEHGALHGQVVHEVSVAVQAGGLGVGVGHVATDDERDGRCIASFTGEITTDALQG